MKTSKLKKKTMFSGSCLTSKLYNKIIKVPSKSHETIPFKGPKWYPASGQPNINSWDCG
jgi:hypothetical protein